MIFLIAVVIGILLGVAMGGRISSLPSLRLRGIWLVLLALIAQFVIFVPVFSERPLLTTGAAVFHIASYVLILGFLVWNRRVRPLIALGLGAVCNFLAIAANGGLMPASATALRSAGLGRAADRLLADGSLGNVVLMGETTRFDALGDWLYLPDTVPFATAFSVGDVLIMIGLIWLIAWGMKSRA